MRPEGAFHASRGIRSETLRPSAARAARGGQPRQPKGGDTSAAKDGLPGGRGGKWARSPRLAPPFLLRRDFHGRPHAGDGRLGGGPDNSKAREERFASSDRRDDGMRNGRGPGKVHCGRHGRFHLKARQFGAAPARRGATCRGCLLPLQPGDIGLPREACWSPCAARCTPSFRRS